MSFKSCDPGIVFELRLSESSARECLRSLPMFVSVRKCVCMEEGEGGFMCSSSSQVASFFGMIIVVERKDEIHLKLNKKIEQDGIKGGFGRQHRKGKQNESADKMSRNSFKQRTFMFRLQSPIV